MKLFWYKAQKGTEILFFLCYTRHSSYKNRWCLNDLTLELVILSLLLLPENQQINTQTTSQTQKVYKTEICKCLK